MGFSYRRSISLGKHLRVNVSKRGISTTAKVGRVSVNSRGSWTVRLLKGLTYRGGKR